MINKDIEYRIGQVVLIRGTITSISQVENAQPSYGFRLANGSTFTLAQQAIAGITTDVPNDKGEESEDVL
jgi:hypothetical protein